jgi:hypothetical protein
MRAALSAETSSMGNNVSTDTSSVGCPMVCKFPRRPSSPRYRYQPALTNGTSNSRHVTTGTDLPGVKTQAVLILVTVSVFVVPSHSKQLMYCAAWGLPIETPALGTPSTFGEASLIATANLLVSARRELPRVGKDLLGNV